MSHLEFVILISEVLVLYVKIVILFQAFLEILLVVLLRYLSRLVGCLYLAAGG